MQWRVARLLGLACLSVIVGLVTGCGSGSAGFGTNSDVELIVSGQYMDEMRVVVSPTEGPFDDAQACREGSAGFGCTRQVTNTRVIYRFKTNSTASSRPFYVYLRNLNPNVSRVGLLRIYMDDKLKFEMDFRVYPNETYHIANIYRNNASAPR